MQANTHLPVLKTHDRHGRRIDQVVFHPAYHETMRLGLENHCAAWAWNHLSSAAPHVARSAISYLLYQVEAGTQCPETMTFASVPVLQRMSPASKARCKLAHFFFFFFPCMLVITCLVSWLDLALSSKYDPRDIPAPGKRGVTIGMSMTERQGGSDVRANTTVATPCDPAVTV